MSEASKQKHYTETLDVRSASKTYMTLDSFANGSHCITKCPREGCHLAALDSQCSSIKSPSKIECKCGTVYCSACRGEYHEQVSQLYEATRGKGVRNMVKTAAS